MKILVDADACPVKEVIVKTARRFKLPVTMLIDTAHELRDGYSEVVTVDKARDSVDFALMRLLDSADIVVTQDFGLAAMALGKGATALNQNGLVFTDENIESLLMQRHMSAKARRGGKRTKGPAKRTAAEDEAFARVFDGLIRDRLPMGNSIREV